MIFLRKANLFTASLLFFVFVLMIQVTAEEGIRVRFVKHISTTLLNQEIVAQVYITNHRAHPVILVGHLNLPSGWKAVPANDILFHLQPNQNIIQTVIIKVPDYEREGEFAIKYEVWSRDNLNIYDSDESIAILKHPEVLNQPNEESVILKSLFVEPEYLKNQEDVKKNSQISLSVTSETHIEAESDETCFITCLIKNNSDQIVEDHLCLRSPEGWLVVPDKKIKVAIPPHETVFEVFGVKIPSNTLSKCYRLHFEMDQHKSRSETVTVEIAPKVLLKVEAENIASYYQVNEPIDIDLVLYNNGNSILDVRLEVDADPRAELRYRNTAIQIEPAAKCITRLHIEPRLSRDDRKQFILLRVIDNLTCQVIFNDTLTLCFSPPISEDDDPFDRIPAYFSTIALGDNGDHVFAVELAGGGIINPDRERFVNFVFRLPTNSRNVIYNADQRLYFGMGEPGFDLHLGDTVYSLSPLTQRSRYGRGAGIDLEKGLFTAGIHYTENTFNNDFNPKESCGYIGYYPAEKFYVEGNYLHRNAQGEPTSNVISISSECQISKKVYSEFEVGKDFNSDARGHDTSAFRAAIRGQTNKDIWFNFEKIHAGSGFYAYYNDVDTFSATIDYPVNYRMRANMSYTKLRQNYKSIYDCYSSSKSYHSNESYVNARDCSLKQRQWQYNANVSYDFQNGGAFTLNGLLLRAYDHGSGSQYDFFQQWGGFTTTFPFKDWTVTGVVSYGQQHDFLKCHTQSFLQRYWWSFNREIRGNFFTYLFYEGGNTDYYDARPWRTSFGGSLGYRYNSSGFAEIFLQRVKNRVDMYELNQISFRLSHTFSNRHHLEVSTQYFHYKKHYPNDFLFLVSYTIPLSIPINKRCDKGNVYGFVEDVSRGSPVADALVNLGGNQCVTDAQGGFAFQNMKKGTHDIKLEILPKQLIAKDCSNQTVEVFGGKKTKISIPVIAPCCIRGEVMLYKGKDPIAMMMNSENGSNDSCQKDPMPGIRVIVDRNHGEEIYTTLTNEKGNFYFPKLRDGDWSVTINSENLPKHYFVVNDEMSFSLKPEEEKKLKFEIRASLPKILPLE